LELPKSKTAQKSFIIHKKTLIQQYKIEIIPQERKSFFVFLMFKLAEKTPRKNKIIINFKQSNNQKKIPTNRDLIIL
jgi:hypothetical protein